MENLYNSNMVKATKGSSMMRSCEIEARDRKEASRKGFQKLVETEGY